MTEPAHRPSAALRAVAGQVDVSSPAQRERRIRILDASIALAASGGFDAVQMRAVAGQAGVALGTLYRYFPSKIHLLVSALERELGLVLERIEQAPVPGDNAIDRVLHVLRRGTRALHRDPPVTEAMTRSFLFADTSVAAEVLGVTSQIERMITLAMQVDEPTNEDRAIAAVIGDLWLMNLVASVTGRAPAADAENRLELAVRLLLSSS